MLNFLIAVYIENSFNHLTHTVQNARMFGGAWAFESWDSSDDDFQPFFAYEIRKNGKALYRDESQEYAGYLNKIAILDYPLPYRVLAHRAHTWAGHGEYTTFLKVTRNRCVKMGSIYIECGGPVFRDFDKDGEMEWVFDDYDHYRYYHRPPKWFLVYKVSSHGKLYLWKKLPNKKKIFLKDTVGLYF